MTTLDARNSADHPRIAWYAAYTKHQHEKGAREILLRKGFDVLLPLYHASHRWKDRTRIISLPVFPSYLFVHANLDRKLDILKTAGVFWLVESGGSACEVPPADIEAIRRIAEFSEGVQPHPYLNCGDRVRVKTGPFAGLQGILTRVKNQCRVVVSVDVLQKSLSIEVDSAALEPISNTQCANVHGMEAKERTA